MYIATIFAFMLIPYWWMCLAIISSSLQLHIDMHCLPILANARAETVFFQATCDVF